MLIRCTAVPLAWYVSNFWEKNGSCDFQCCDAAKIERSSRYLSAFRSFRSHVQGVEGSQVTPVMACVYLKIRRLRHSSECILSIKPRCCKPCVPAALFQAAKLCVVLVYKGSAINWDRPADCDQEVSLGLRREQAVVGEVTYSSARSRDMPYLRRLIAAMRALPSSSFAALSGNSVSSWFTEYTLSMTLVRITGHRFTTVS